MCLIFVGEARCRKFFDVENSPNYDGFSVLVELLLHFRRNAKRTSCSNDWWWHFIVSLHRDMLGTDCILSPARRSLRIHRKSVGQSLAPESGSNNSIVVSSLSDLPHNLDYVIHPNPSLQWGEEGHCCYGFHDTIVLLILSARWILTYTHLIHHLFSEDGPIITTSTTHVNSNLIVWFICQRAPVDLLLVCKF